MLLILPLVWLLVVVVMQVMQVMQVMECGGDHARAVAAIRGDGLNPRQRLGCQSEASAESDAESNAHAGTG